MKFLVDMPVTPRAVDHLIAAGHEAVHASALDLATSDDEDILERARREGRVVITADLDYPRLLAAQKAQTPGIILFRGGSFSRDEMLEMLDAVLSELGPGRIEGAIAVVDRTRIRWRKLPLDDEG